MDMSAEPWQTVSGSVLFTAVLYCWLSCYEFEQSPRESAGQTSPVSCCPWGPRESG